MKPIASGRSSAFTLVELLVVIGIIAVLVSMLLPSLNKARNAAREIQCQANLKQISNAVAMYESENKGFMPAGGIAGANGWSLDGQIMKYLTGKDPGTPSSPITPKPVSKVFQCPFDMSPSFYANPGDYQSYGLNWGQTIQMMDPPGKPNLPSRLFVCIRPSRLFSWYVGGTRYQSATLAYIVDCQPANKSSMVAGWPKHQLSEFQRVTTGYYGDGTNWGCHHRRAKTNTWYTYNGDPNVLFFDLHVEKVAFGAKALTTQYYYQP